MDDPPSPPIPLQRPPSLQTFGNLQTRPTPTCPRAAAPVSPTVCCSSSSGSTRDAVEADPNEDCGVVASLRQRLRMCSSSSSFSTRCFSLASQTPRSFTLTFGSRRTGFAKLLVARIDADLRSSNKKKKSTQGLEEKKRKETQPKGLCFILFQTTHRLHRPRSARGRGMIRASGGGPLADPDKAKPSYRA